MKFPNISQSLKNKLLSHILSSNEISAITSRMKLTKVLSDKVKNVIDNSDVKIRISLVNENSKVCEVVALTQLKNDIDMYLESDKVEQLSLFKSLDKTLIIFIKSSEKLEDYKIMNLLYFDDDLMVKLVNDFKNLTKNVLEILDNDYDLQSVKGEYLVFKPKDSKPYKRIYSSKYNRYISDKNYGWYLRKPFLNSFIDSKTIEDKHINREKINIKSRMIDYEFYNLISKLKTSSQAAIASPDDNDDFSKFLHIKREIETDFIKLVKSVVENDEKKLIFLVGNSGDGKSQLLKMLKEYDKKLYYSFIVHNDATESYYVNKDSIYTLLDVLKPFADSNIGNGREKIIIAINMGIIGKFLDRQEIYQFCEIKEFFDNSNILSEHKVKDSDYKHENIDYISFSEYNIFGVNEKGIETKYIENFFDKIFDEYPNNLFRDSFNSIPTVIQKNCPVCFNYSVLSDKNLRRFIIKLLLYIHLKDKILMTPRIIWNFIYELLMGNEIESKYSKHDCDVDASCFMKNLYFNKLFNKHTVNPIINSFIDISYIIENNQFINELINDLALLKKQDKDLNSLIINTTLSTNSAVFLKSVNELFHGNFENSSLAILSLIRFTSFQKLKDIGNEHLDKLDKYSKMLFEYNFVDKNKNIIVLKKFRNLLKEAVSKWNGYHYRSDLLYTSLLDAKARRAIKCNCKITHDTLRKISDKSKFSTIIKFDFDDELKSINIDFNLFMTVLKTDSGYLLNLNERLENIRLNNFIEDIISISANENEQYICDNRDNTYLLVYDGVYDSFEFRKG